MRVPIAGWVIVGTGLYLIGVTIIICIRQCLVVKYSKEYFLIILIQLYLYVHYYWIQLVKYTVKKKSNLRYTRIFRYLGITSERCPSPRLLPGLTLQRLQRCRVFGNVWEI